MIEQHRFHTLDSAFEYNFNIKVKPKIEDEKQNKLFFFLSISFFLSFCVHLKAYGKASKTSIRTAFHIFFAISIYIENIKD